MTKDTTKPENAPLETLRTLVMDHGDAFRWSISKRGRIWLTLTHWSDEQYSTAVEVDPFTNLADVVDALAVLCYGHYLKCFQSKAHDDTWTNTEQTRNVVEDAKAMLQQIPRFGLVPDQVVDFSTGELPAERDNGK